MQRHLPPQVDPLLEQPDATSIAAQVGERLAGGVVDTMLGVIPTVSGNLSPRKIRKSASSISTLSRAAALKSS
jgi:hypothetical protein